MQKMKLMVGLLAFTCASVQGADHRHGNQGREANRFGDRNQQRTALEIEQGFSAPEGKNDAWQPPREWPIITKVYGVGAENLKKSQVSMMFTPKSDKLYHSQLSITKKQGTVYSPVPLQNLNLPLTLNLPESQQNVKYLDVTTIIRTLPETVQYFEGSQQKAMTGIEFLNNFIYYANNGNYESALGMLSCLQGQKAADFGHAIKPVLQEDAVKNVLEAKVSWADGVVGSLSAFMKMAEKAAKNAGKQLQDGAAGISEEALKKAMQLKDQAAYQAATFLGKFNMAFTKRVNAWGGMVIGAALFYGALKYFDKLK